MKRYIADKAVLDKLLITPLGAMGELAKEKIITDEPLIYAHLPFVSLMLTDDEVEWLNKHGIFPTEEHIGSNAALDGNYERIRSFWFKSQRRALTGAGTKVGVMDSGCNTAFVHCDFTVNFADGGPFSDVLNHGTKVTSIINHSNIGVAPGCIMYNMKVLTNAGSVPESGVLAALDYVIDQDLDVVNMSFTYDSVNFRAAIAEVVANGNILCAASGNSTIETMTLGPATFPGVVAVNAITEAGGIFYKNVIPNSGVPNSHGITIACSGVNCFCVSATSGNLVGEWGTSVACPFFTGTYAVYKEALPGASRKEVLDYILDRAYKREDTLYFGAGTPSF